MVCPLALEHAEKALTGGIVPAVTHGTHRADKRIPLQESLVVAAAELTAPIRMQDHGPAALALPDRHLNGTDDHLPILAMVHRPADHQLTEQVDDHAQI